LIQSGENISVAHLNPLVLAVRLDLTSLSLIISYLLLGDPLGQLLGPKATDRRLLS
jgi:hypothetical protein